MEREQDMSTRSKEDIDIQTRNLDEERQEIQRLIQEQSQSSQAFLAGKFTFN